MPRTPDDFPGDRLESQTVYQDQYGDLPTDLGGLLFSDGYFYARDSYGVFNLRQSEIASVTIHAPTHIHNGSDEIDGDQLDIDFSPTNYTQDITPPEVSDIEHLAAHLAGIDGYFDEKLGIEEHKNIRHLIHFIDGGPAGGFASGAYMEVLPAGNPFHTSEIWYTSAAKTQKIVELTITRNQNKTPATENWKMYDTDGSTVIEEITDSIVYSGIIETSRTRTIS